ncbi:hypothetical protein Fmac_021404 [Flemingia macrophylla]|uniref:Uncharacterized protein n=1 Tax=Flemingia macrophylla TaxID=520843 RepID=A0ABD1LWZ9_9FABA
MRAYRSYTLPGPVCCTVKHPTARAKAIHPPLNPLWLVSCAVKHPAAHAWNASRHGPPYLNPSLGPGSNVSAGFSFQSLLLHTYVGVCPVALQIKNKFHSTTPTPTPHPRDSLLPKLEKASIEKSLPDSSDTCKAFRQAVVNTLEWRLFYIPSFKIFCSVVRLFDYGPVLSLSLVEKNEVENITWTNEKRGPTTEYKEKAQ